MLAANQNRNAIYLCEQAAEKIIRAVLTSEGVHGGVKHHLDEYVDLIPDANPVKPALRMIEYLAAYATAYRYPTAAGRIKATPGVREVDEGLARVEAALREVAARFEVDLSQPNTPARRPAPLR